MSLGGNLLSSLHCLAKHGSQAVSYHSLGSTLLLLPSTDDRGVSSSNLALPALKFRTWPLPRWTLVARCISIGDSTGLGLACPSVASPSSLSASTSGSSPKVFSKPSRLFILSTPWGCTTVGTCPRTAPHRASSPSPSLDGRASPVDLRFHADGSLLGVYRERYSSSTMEISSAAASWSVMGEELACDCR